MDIQFSGFIALPAAYSFITRFMSNHSAENPDGILNHAVLKSFYGVSGNSNNLTYQTGYEVRGYLSVHSPLFCLLWLVHSEFPITGTSVPSTIASLYIP